MKSASSAASSSGQQCVKRSVADAEPEAKTGVPMEMSSDESATLPSVMGTKSSRRIAPSRSTVGVTTQEGIDGYRENAMRIASVEQVELGNIMALSVTEQLHLSGAASLSEADGWNLENHSHLTVARDLHENSHASIWVATRREREDGRDCSAQH